MIPAGTCNGFHGIGVLDYAYLSLNVYHDPKDKSLLGAIPRAVPSLDTLSHIINDSRTGWAQLILPRLHLSPTGGPYAEFYVKLYFGKVQHMMVAFRGTDNWGDDKEDIKTWYQAVLDNPDAALPTPDYWHQAVGFMKNVAMVIGDMAIMGLLAKGCDYHITGHSLGGALANLVAASALICVPSMQHHQGLPIAPKVISFNAPGIGAMPYVSSSKFHAGQVISMRAQFDAVSAIGKPYGYVINNTVPEGRALAKMAFGIHYAKTFSSGFVQDILQAHCDRTPACQGVEDSVEAIDAVGLAKQHSMGNFLKLIANNPDSISTTFTMLANWSINHGGMNHDEAGAPMYV